MRLSHNCPDHERQRQSILNHSDFRFCTTILYHYYVTLCFYFSDYT